MSGGSGSKKRSGFQITSVTSDFNQSAANVILTIVQSPSASASASAGLQGSSSQPTTPSLKRKYGSQDAAAGAAGQGACSSSRFRVVRLAGGGAGGGGRADPYRRGRWTCTDFLEQQEGAGLRRVIDSMRHAHSLESLETIGRERDRGGVHSQDTAHLPPRPIAAKQREGLGGGPPSPSLPEPAGPDGGETSLDHAPPPSRPRPPEGPPRPRNAPPPLRLEVDAAGRSVLRLSHSQPSSPPAGRSLDRSIFSLPTDASSSSNSLVAIDNKIEQAMDLVKSHLMLAVREEVELLKEQIKELQERNQQLERENRILRVVTHAHAGRAARSSPNSVVMATRAEKLNIDEAR